MNSNIKNIAILAGLFVAGSAMLAYNKVKGLTAIFDHMTIRPHSFPKRVKASLTNISFEIDIKISNPTAEDFAVSGYIATLNRIDVYFRGKFLGTADLILDEISVPARGFTILPNIHVVISPQVLLANIMTLTQQLTSGMDLNDLKFVGIIEVLGTEYVVNN